LLNADLYQIADEITFTTDDVRWPETVSLGKICEISQGVIEAPDKLTNKHIENSDRKDVKVGDGVFVLSKDEYLNLSLTIKEKKLCVPYVDPKDVSRYHIKSDIEKYLIYADKLAREKIAEQSEFQTIKRHLDQFQTFITSSNQPYGLHRSRESHFFTKPKILFKNMFVRPDFALDLEKRFVGFSFSSIIQKDKSIDLRYILAILNSQLGAYWFHINGKRRGAGLDVGVKKLRSFPIVRPQQKDQQQVIEFVDKIINIKKNKSNEDTSILEQALDKLVYKIYEFTPDEIDIVESCSRE
jgi:adenine-specific DNA-methyltransferase